MITSINIILKISFLLFSNEDIAFTYWKLIYRPYTTTKALNY